MLSVSESNCLDPDQDRHSVGPNLGSNCMQRISADDKLLLARKELNTMYEQDHFTNFIKGGMAIAVM